MFENNKELVMTENILEAIRYFGFDKDPNLEGKVKFRCYYEIGINLTEEESDIFWDILHEVLNGKDIKEQIRKITKDMFSVYTMLDITRAKENLDKATTIIKK